MKDIRPIKKDPYDKIRVHEIEESKDKQEFDKKKKKKSNFLLANLYIIVNKFVEFFANDRAAKHENEALEEHFLKLKKKFNQIREEDMSSDLSFYKNFALCWKQTLKILQNEHLPPHTKRLLKILVHELETFLENKEFSLSYFLKDYHQDTWLPFSYIEMIQRLHLECQKNPENNHLKQWCEITNKLTYSI